MVGQFVTGLATFETREAAAGHVAALIEGALRHSIGLRGEANLWVSGGSTPQPVFEQLSKAGLGWDKVGVGLVDERWVPATDARSNAGLVQRTLLQNAAAQPRTFLPMYVDGDTIEADAEAMNTAYQKAFTDRPIVLLGMGPDGHTASWFPGVEDLQAVMSADAERWVVPVDASAAPVAGDTPARITLTGSALHHCGLAILYITGEDKRTVLENRAANLPIHHAERLLGSRLKEVWAP